MLLILHQHNQRIRGGQGTRLARIGHTIIARSSHPPILGRIDISLGRKDLILHEAVILSEASHGRIVRGEVEGPRRSDETPPSTASSESPHPYPPPSATPRCSARSPAGSAPAPHSASTSPH